MLVIPTLLVYLGALFNYFWTFGECVYNFSQKEALLKEIAALDKQLAGLNATQVGNATQGQ